MRRGVIAVGALACVAAVNLFAAAARGVDVTFSKLPLRFEPNRGQFDPRVRFAARGPGYALLLMPDQALLAAQGSVLRMRFGGADNKSTIGATDPLPGRSNYYRTHVAAARSNVRSLMDATRLENVPGYASVRYANVYRGIDVIYHGNQRELEYDLVIASGADPRAIRLIFDGIQKMHIGDDGDLVLQLARGEIRQHKPVAHQGSQRVDVRYRIVGSRQVGLSIGQYDRTRPLTIDPAVSYGTFVGGSGGDFASAVAIDSSGNAYITGQTASTDFPLVPPQTAPISGHEVLFITKLNATGTALVYSTYFDDYPTTVYYNVGYGIKVDTAGEAYITGLYGNNGILIMRLNAAGGLLYGVTLNDGEGRGIAIDSAGFAYVTGQAGSTFPVTSGAFQTSGGGTLGDAFVSKLNTNDASDATSIVYSTYLGGALDDEGFAIAIDAAGNAYVTGMTGSSDFPVTASAYQTTFGGDHDAFLSKLNATGSGLLYSTFLGGSFFEEGEGVAVDRSNNAYIAGFAESDGLPTTAGAYQTSWTLGDCRANATDPAKPCSDAFVAKFNPSATGAASLVYSTYLGGPGEDYANAMAIDAAGNVYVAGYTLGSAWGPQGPFPTVNPISGFNQLNSQGFIAELNAAGSALLFSTYYTDQPSGIVLDGMGSVYVAGGTYVTTGIATTGAYQTTNHGGEDAFVAKMSGFLAPPTITSQPQSQTISLYQTASLNVVAIGSPAPTYQWYTGTTGTTTNPIGGAISATYTTPQLINTTRYWARATNGSGSADSNTATITIAFTDDPLTADVSVIRAVHINELRARINGLRSRYGLGAYPFADLTLTAGVTIVRSQHIIDLRQALSDVYTAAGRMQPTYNDPTLTSGMPVRKAHIVDLRNAVIAIE